MQKYYFLYKTTNMLNGKFYLGKHTTTDVNDGYLGSGKILKRSIEKYGEQAFKREILEYFKTEDELIEAESSLINEEVIADSNCMNIRIGGSGGGGFTPEQQKENARRRTIKIKWLKENDPEWVKRKSENSKRINAERKRKGTTSTPPKREIGTYKHTTEIKQKISESKKGKNKGENNPSHGTCWIYNDDTEQNQRINQNELESFLMQGWKKGRKRKYYRN